MHRNSRVGLLDPSIYRSGLEGLVVLEDLVCRHTCASNLDLDRCLVGLGNLVSLEDLAVLQLRGLAARVVPAILEPQRCYLCYLSALEGQVALDPQDFHCHHLD